MKLYLTASFYFHSTFFFWSEYKLETKQKNKKNKTKKTKKEEEEERSDEYYVTK